MPRTGRVGLRALAQKLQRGASFAGPEQPVTGPMRVKPWCSLQGMHIWSERGPGWLSPRLAQVWHSSMAARCGFGWLARMRLWGARAVAGALLGPVAGALAGPVAGSGSALVTIAVAAVGTVLGGALGERVAVAAPRRGLQVAYVAPSTCPGRGAFEEAVLGRLSASKRREVHGRLDVRIEAVDGRFRGRLRVPESSDASLTREVWSDDCTELVRALGFVGAVLIEPAAASGSEPPPFASEAENEMATESAAVTPRELDGFAAGRAASGERDAIPAALRNANTPGAQQARQQARHKRMDRRARASAQNPNSEQSRSRVSPGHWIGRVALGGTGHTGIAPKATLGPRLSLDIGREPAAGNIGYLGRVSMAAAWSARVPGTVGDAEFSWFTSRLEVCGSVASGPRFGATPCALADIGTYRAKGQRAPKLQSSRELWLSVGTSIRAEATLTGPYSLYGEGAVAAPLRRPHFYFARSAGSGGEDEVHRVPGASFSAGIGISVRFL